MGYWNTELVNVHFWSFIEENIVDWLWILVFTWSFGFFYTHSMCCSHMKKYVWKVSMYFLNGILMWCISWYLACTLRLCSLTTLIDVLYCCSVLKSVFLFLVILTSYPLHTNTHKNSLKNRSQVLKRHNETW